MVFFLFILRNTKTKKNNPWRFKHQYASYFLLLIMLPQGGFGFPHSYSFFLMPVQTTVISAVHGITTSKSRYAIKKICYV